jgi:acetoin utilization deacetylase AcuC-like enzyme
LTSWADENCQGRIGLFLEGGYDLEAARDCSLAVVAALLGEISPGRSDEAVISSQYGESSTFLSIVEQAKQLWDLE